MEFAFGFRSNPLRFGLKSRDGSFVGSRVNRHYTGDFARHFRSLIPSTSVALSEIPNDMDDYDLRDRAAFAAFFLEQTGGKADMVKSQFITYEDVKELLQSGKVYMDDFEALWTSSVGDAAGLNEQEAFEVLCMVRDLPDPDDEKFLDEEYQKLTSSGSLIKNRRGKRSGATVSKAGLSYTNFINWSDVQDIIAEEVLTLEEVTEIWRKVVGALDSRVDRVVFGKLNKALDDLIEEKESAQEKVETASSTTDVEDPWAFDFNPKTVFEEDSYKEMREYFDGVTAAKAVKLFSFADLSSWSDIQEVSGLLSLEMIQCYRFLF